MRDDGRPGEYILRVAPVMVRAVRWTGGNWPEVEVWLRPLLEEPYAQLDDDGGRRLPGTIRFEDAGRYVRCIAGTWLVSRSPVSEVLVMTDEAFRARYDPAVFPSTVDRDPEVDCATGAGSRKYTHEVAERHRNAPASELARWRSWAAGLLKAAEATDEAAREKIAAVLEAPSAIQADLVPRVTGDPVVEACARVSHEVYRAGLGDPAMSEWDLSPEHERAVARDCVVSVLSGETPEQWFGVWRAQMAAGGWVLGPIRDEIGKRHPNLVARYVDLPEEQRELDRLFAVTTVAVARAVEELEEPCRGAVFEVRGVAPPPEQFAEFRREFARATSSAWRTPIHDAPDVVVHRPHSPYTRSGLTSFIDDQVDSMLRLPSLWGTPKEVELQVLLLLEVRAFVVAGGPAVDDVVHAYERFVTDLFGDAASADPMASQLSARGRAGEFVALMGEFVASQRSASPPAPPSDGSLVASWASARDRDRDRLVALFERHCECRPIDTARPSHSHDCDVEITDDVRTVIHRVVSADAAADCAFRAATDDEVREARGRLVAEAIWDGVASDAASRHEGKS